MPEINANIGDINTSHVVKRVLDFGQQSRFELADRFERRRPHAPFDARDGVADADQRAAFVVIYSNLKIFGPNHSESLAAPLKWRNNFFPNRA